MIRLYSGCKINLGLRALARRADGYHDLESIFYPLSHPRDELLIEPGADSGIALKGACGIEPQDNLVYKAYMAFAGATGYTPGLAVTLVKRVPSGAGLGGGSADAAAMLIWLNRSAPHPLNAADLLEAGAQLGADIPFFFINRPCAVAGKGEKLTPTAFHGEGFALVLVCPPVRIGTAWAFLQLDRERAAAGNGLTKASAKARSFNSGRTCLEIASLDFSNDLESVVFAAYPELFSLKQSILRLGACHSAMSGSGSSIYGIFDDVTVASAAAKTLRKQWPQVYNLPMRDFGM